MKKLLSVFAAAAMLFGFASCSGDLHDKEVVLPVPVTIEDASWYYYDITVYGDNTSTGNFILNGSAGQSLDTVMPSFEAKKGGVFYFTADKTKLADGKYELLTSYQEDNPAYTPVPGKVRFYIYTNETACNFYCFGNDESFDGSLPWPGLAMTKCGAADPTIFVDGCKVINITSEANAGEVIYFMGGWVPGNTWNTAATCIGVVIDGSATYTFATPVESVAKSFKVETRVLKDVTNLWDGEGAKINGAGDFTADASSLTFDGSHYYWVLDCNGYTASLEKVE